MSVAPAVSARALVKRYPVFKRFGELLRHPFRKSYVTALDGADFAVEPGRCVCLLGPNGAGKTTLIKVLTTLVLPDGGEAFVNGRDVRREGAAIRREVGLAVSEDRSFYWRLTGRENLEFFGVLNDLRPADLRRRIDEVLRLTNLAAAADRRFDTYSSGMRQMLAFARTLLADARLLFVDEPTRSLDPRAADRVRRFLRGELVERQGRTVVWATHNLAEAAEVGHEIAVIDRGRVKLAGTVESLTAGGRRTLKSLYEEAVEESTAAADALAAAAEVLE